VKHCPHCQEALKDDAIVCTHCGHQFRQIEGGHGPKPTPNVLKIGCGIAIISMMAAILWYFSALYQ
jgi:hypothetical protein